MPAGPTISETLAGEVAAIGAGGAGARADHAFARACIDFVTCSLIGAGLPVTQATLRHFAATDPGRQATLIGRAERLSPASAAFVNATAAHGLDLDDGHTRAGGHPGAAVFPATFAMAEHLGADAADVIAAVVAGYQTMVRVATMMHPHSARTGWHNTAVAGTFGATAAVATLQRLDAARIAHAFGLAGSFAGGLLEFLAEGPDSKRIHPGMAARDGITCAGLAAEGLTGPSRVFEGRHGVFNAFIGGASDRSGLETPGLEIGNVYFKLYPCCRHYHAAIDGLIDLRAEHGLEPAAIRRVHLGLYGVAVRGHDHREADTMLGAQMSAPIAAGLALLDGAVAVGGFSPESLGRDALRELVARVDVAVDESCERAYPRQRSGAVQIELADGRRLERRVLDPRGEGAHPLSDADLEGKFRANCVPVLGADASAEVLGLIWNFRRERDAFGRLLRHLAAAERHGAGRKMEGRA
jgi:2-methylcitrate dehydratase PrpD